MNIAHFENIEKTIIVNLRNCKKQLCIAVAWFTNPNIFNVLKQLSQNELKITLIIADDEINYFAAKSHFEDLLSNGIKIRVTNKPNLMHHKFCIIDNRLLINGSYNWTKTAETKNYENIIITNDMTLINQFMKEFERIVSYSNEIQKITSDLFNKYEASNMELKESIGNEDEVIEERKSNVLSDEFINSIEFAYQQYLNGKYKESIRNCSILIKEKPEISDLYVIISKCYWRLEDNNNQIIFAKKAIEIDNHNFEAQNLLGIAYASIGDDQKSIKHYEICINAEPKNYKFIGNRALSYVNLESNRQIPIKLRNQFKEKANRDFSDTIKLTTEAIKEETTYDPYYSRGIAYFYMHHNLKAKADLKNGIKKFEMTPKEDRDIAEYKIMKLVINKLDRQ